MIDFAIIHYLLRYLIESLCIDYVLFYVFYRSVSEFEIRVYGPTVDVESTASRYADIRELWGGPNIPVT